MVWKKDGWMVWKIDGWMVSKRDGWMVWKRDGWMVNAIIDEVRSIVEVEKYSELYPSRSLFGRSPLKTLTC